jgi:hypothetical protein
MDLNPTASPDFMRFNVSDTKEVLEGIRLVLEEIREMRRDAGGDRQRAEEDRRRSEEDRKRAQEDRKRAEEDRKRADEDRRWFRIFMAESRAQFAQYVRESERRERGASRALVIIGDVGRRIIKTQDRHTQLLEGILRAIQRRGGRGSNLRN